MTIVHHSGICPADMDASLRFYRDGIGLDVLIDTVLETDLEPLLGRVHTTRIRTVFLGDARNRDGGIVELLDLGVPELKDDPQQPGVPTRGLFLLSVQVDVPVVLSRLADLGLGGTPRILRTGSGELLAATVLDPDGVTVELLRADRAVLGG